MFKTYYSFKNKLINAKLVFMSL